MQGSFDNKTSWRGQQARAITDIDAVDQGLRSHMIRVYNYMSLGLGLTGLVAYFSASNAALMAALFGTPLQWVVIFAPLIMVIFFSFRIQQMSLSAAQAFFWLYSAAMGLSMSAIFLVYTHQSIARVFFITASVFAAMSLYGYTTRRDLSAMGSFMMMGVIGIIIAGLVNLFLQSSALQFVLSIVGVIAFTGLTAYNTQEIKYMCYEGDMEEIAGKKALIGALKLYLSFINLFISLMHLFGERR